LGGKRVGLVFGVWVIVLSVAVFGVVLNVPLVGGSGTIYIRADGSIDPPTAPISSVDNVTYTFTDNIYDEIVVERNNTIIDGKGYMLQGSGVGFYLSVLSNVTIKNTNVIGFSPAVALISSFNCTLIESNITSSSGAGVMVNGGAFNTIAKNDIRNNYDGVLLRSSYNSLYENNITNNYRYGLSLDYSSNNLLRNNSMVGNTVNFGVIRGFVHDVDASNTVDGKPIYYWVARQNLQIPPDAGYVALVNSYNITVKGLTLTSNDRGILLASTTNSSITNNRITNNYSGIHLSESSNNTISDNDISGNNGYGIGLMMSSHNTILANNITENWSSGVYFDGSSFNTIYKNDIINNGDGVFLDSWWGAPSDNVISDNVITINRDDGIEIYGTVWRESYELPSRNVIIRNNITSNTDAGVNLVWTTFNTISDNNINGNNGGVHLLGSSYNTVSGNSITINAIGVNVAVLLLDRYPTYNNIFGNNITSNRYGVRFFGIQTASSENALFNNNITNNDWEGVYSSDCSSLKIYHNNFINNTGGQAYSPSSYNYWDDGYPSGGNYWSDYTGSDLFVGLYQNETGSDGISDTPYIIDANNQDHYPLINPWIPGSPISYFTYSPKFPPTGETVTFNASASYDYKGYIISYTWDFGDGNTTTVANPSITHIYTAEGVYLVNLTVTDNDGLSRSITRSITVGIDSTPPTTLDNYDDLWHTTDFTITLKATDDLSGVAETYYKINDGPTKTVSADGQPLITTPDANNKLEYWSKDKAGNEENHHILTGIKLDKTAPTGTILINNDDAYATSTSVTLTLTATDDTSGVYKVRYSNDGVWDTEPWENPSPTKTWTLTSGDGTKTVYYQIKDNAGLISITYSDTIILDTTLPSGFIAINDGATYTTTTTVTLTLSATDVTSGIAEMRFSNDNTTYTEWQTYTTSKSWTLQEGDGTKTVYVQFKDQAGLISTNSDTIVLDTAPPSGSVTIAGGATYTNSTSVTLTLSANDATSGIAQMRFSNDNVTWSDWEPYATSKTWTLPVGDGLKGVTVQYRDNTGLVSSYSDSIILDTTKPTANAGADQTVNEDTMVTFDASASTDENGIATYTWTFTDVTTKTLTGEKPTYTFNAPGVYTITLNVTDAAGNWAIDTVIITVSDITKPVANAGSDQTVTEDTIVTFNASQSSDNVGIMNYTWTFVDVTPQTLKGTKPTYNFTTPGTYIVTLTVKDAAGNQATDTVTITVLLDTDGDKTPDVTDTDDDNDGMPDSWETENGLNPLDEADASLDPDGDGLTNLQEYQADTNPNASNAQAFPMWIVGAAVATIAVAGAVAILWKRRK